MNPDVRPLEAAFEPVEPETPPASQPAETSVSEDLTEFFSRLSSLDDLSWSDEPAPDQSAEDETQEATAEPAPSPRVPPVTASSGKPRISILHSEAVGRMDATEATDRDDPLGSGEEGAGTGGRERGRSRSAHVFRMAATVAVLFGIGLGGGWAALSLPSRFEKATAGWRQTLDKATERAVAAQPPAATKEDEAALAGDEEGAPAAAATQPAKPKGHAARTAARRAKSQPARATAKAQRPQEPLQPSQQRPARADGAGARALASAAGTQPSASATGQPSISAEAAAPAAPAPGTTVSTRTAVRAEPGAKPAAEPTGAGPSTAQATAPAAPQPAAGPATAGSAEPAAAPDGHFALQVGACGSYACVNQFRTLLLRTVSAQAIQITPQPAQADGKPIQRIRIAPLDKAEALRIKDKLAESDPRLKAAFLVALP